jgi:hypothetical protein
MDFVDPVLGTDELELEATAPVAQRVIDGNLGVDGHEMIQADAVRPLAVDIAQAAAQIAAAVVRIVPEGELALDIDAVQRSVVIGEPEEHETAGCREIGR